MPRDVSSDVDACFFSSSGVTMMIIDTSDRLKRVEVPTIHSRYREDEDAIYIDSGTSGYIIESDVTVQLDTNQKYKEVREMESLFSFWNILGIVVIIVLVNKVLMPRLTVKNAAKVCVKIVKTGMKMLYWPVRKLIETIIRDVGDVVKEEMEKEEDKRRRWRRKKIKEEMEKEEDK